MNMIKPLFLSILTIVLFSACNFIKNSFTLREKTETLVNAVINEDYDKAITYFAMEHEMAAGVDIATMKDGLANLRTMVVENFGTELDYRLMSAVKSWSTEKEGNTPANTTLGQVEFSNAREFGVFSVLSDDISGKILNINVMDVKLPIPNMLWFWLFGLLAICIPIFNVYVILQVRRSPLKRKWLKYLAIVLLNVPAFAYNAVSGFSIELLNFQVLLGISFSYLGYLNAAWTFGLPLGGLYWLWKLKHKKSEIVETEVLDDLAQEPQ